MASCSPHRWYLPSTTSTGLECAACGRWLDFLEGECEGWRLTMIMRGVRRRYSRDYADEFSRRLLAAVDHSHTVRDRLFA